MSCTQHTENLWSDMPGFGTLESMDRKNHNQQREIGLRCDFIRRAKNLKNVTWAKAIGLEKNAWNEIKQGRVWLHPQHAYRIAQLTGVDFNYIYNGNMALLPEGLRDAILVLQQEHNSAKRRR